MILALLSACNPLPETVTMTGAVGDTPYGGGGVVGGAEVAVLDPSYAPLDTQVADGTGAFAVQVPAGVPFFVTVSAEGHVPTAFSGTAGVYDFTAPEGYPWVASAAWMDELRADFVNCPAVGLAGAVVTGEVRAYTSDTTWVSIDTATVRVLAPDDTEYTACYLDDDGVSTVDGAVTGDTGRFAVFGVPEGPILVDIRYTDMGGTVPVEIYEFVAPADGLVPLYPALVQLLY